MNVEDIESAMADARRFITRAEEAVYVYKHGGKNPAFASKEGGAVKRASLDLTRALARMRTGR